MLIIFILSIFFCKYSLLFISPEIVQNQPYGEKADIWALGCILYQMAALEPPFFSNNMLTLVKKIVDGEYRALPEDVYSKRLSETVDRSVKLNVNIYCI